MVINRVDDTIDIERVNGTLAGLQPVDGHAGDAVIMHESAGDHETMENLMGVKPNVQLAREEPLGDPHGVQDGARDVQDAHNGEPMELSGLDGLLPAVNDAIMRGRRDPRQPEEDKDAGSQRPETRPREKVERGHDDGADAQRDHDAQIDDLELPIAVEAVVKPGDERPDGEKGDAAIVELGEEFPDGLLLVTAQSVIEEGKSHADDGAGKEATEDQFLF